MRKESKKYAEMWRLYTPAILGKIKNQGGEITLKKEVLELCGNRKKSGYNFKITFINGKVQQKLESSAVARDLRDVLLEIARFRELSICKTVDISYKQKYGILNVIVC